MKNFVIIASIFLFFSIALTFQSIVWNECRDAGYSKMFCMTLISRK